MSTFQPVLPHDLLWGLPAAALPIDAPAWVFEAVGLGHPVVVRRARVAAGLVAVGVRGRSRDQRYATHMRLDDVQRCVRPEGLIAITADADWPALRALEQIRSVMDALGQPWGVAGGAGFELASGVPVLHAGSDLDLILRTPDYLDRQHAARLLEQLASAACRIDLQLQTPFGAVALREWAGSSRQVLLKAEDGARLVDNPWLAQAVAA
ncbi:malonate decarboxylase holo-ACP synthase [Pseudomonas petrae]|uniref:Phosphoribosyl-dephospho-CoA transferase n=1 Tax=Pseudomonas petrae TaxID=2912190 RepID=A0ABS9I568_9PSED|nr:malonate decarboxylase holo-ACP synthase [Pseudomonas petrae]MCF7533488.1 malonate decarboxylase holo-ACP synthase [Pseudomonas petrae]MCF7537909.1 malonate decarboxylase holo-ACP synthase [Pseudomonas petrae]MCF7542489.1 malonate decarboxylase holo-ACP synthase [Pseudomonas petrae]MCF7555255.1 malonate decarboxylase holo-ACP synthase [Pseudomonas petrae]